MRFNYASKLKNNSLKGNSEIGGVLNAGLFHPISLLQQLYHSFSFAE